MNENGLRARIRRGDMLCGTFVKTPEISVIEVLAMSGLDFICLDAEHAAFDRGRMDACLAMAKALDLPCLVRVPEGTGAQILMALDAGAVGVVIPHCYSVEKAETVSRAARFGHGGRGYAGSTRSAGYATRGMAEVIAMNEETIVLGQIEEPEGVKASDAIAAVEGIDGLFVGPADLAVCFGKTDANDPAVREAMGTVCKAAKAHGKGAVTFAANTDTLDALKDLGMTMLFFGSEHGWILQGAKATLASFRQKTG